VIDFGSARFMGMMPADGQGVGTECYFAPEVGPPSDRLLAVLGPLISLYQSLRIPMLSLRSAWLSSDCCGQGWFGVSLPEISLSLSLSLSLCVSLQPSAL
jgi:hypothetical protein